MLLFGKTRQIHKKLSVLIKQATQLGLPEQDITYAKDFLEHNEYGLCFDQIVEQLYEYQIPITAEFYALVVELSGIMKKHSAEYLYLQELVK